ncbi:MAG: carbon monoxide dehydrogenase [Chloroflexi bacterium]|nr:MAG: carbon monoxide dehydrogenase [Chloroflexota bacterium]MBL1197218.1 carbon monoxide dehydrogenase [Chloroflexota bacterium]NOH14513.1 AAA family ATPase [Chloroflexota bacterium]
MTTTIALAGKGGVGKTTIAAMVIKYLMQSQPGSILAIDADPSSNLNMVLGLDLEWTVGEIREGMLGKVKESLTAGGAAMGTLPGGMSKRDYLDYEVQSALAEGQRFDLIAMGRSEGPGCYCAVNHNLREVVDSISKSYRYVVIDNEAGMEHLSRRTTRDVQHLLIVTDPTQRGLVAAERIAGFRNDMDINIENSYLIVNRLMGEMPKALKNKVEEMDVEFLGAVPANQQLAEFEFSSEPLVQLGDDSPVYQAVEAMLNTIID